MFEGLFLPTMLTTLLICLLGEPLLKGLLRTIGFYDIVEEGTSHVYLLFGHVIGVLREPGLYFLWFKRVYLD